MSAISNETLQLLVECECALDETGKIAKHCGETELKKQIALLGRLSKKISKHIHSEPEKVEA